MRSAHFLVTKLTCRVMGIYYQAKNKLPTKVKKAIYIINFFHKMRSAHFLVTFISFCANMSLYYPQN